MLHRQPTFTKDQKFNQLSGSDKVSLEIPKKLRDFLYHLWQSLVVVTALTAECPRVDKHWSRLHTFEFEETQQSLLLAHEQLSPLCFC